MINAIIWLDVGCSDATVVKEEQKLIKIHLNLRNIRSKGDDPLIALALVMEFI